MNSLLLEEPKENGFTSSKEQVQIIFDIKMKILSFYLKVIINFLRMFAEENEQ
jgi:hypothetical protein